MSRPRPRPSRYVGAMRQGVPQTARATLPRALSVLAVMLMFVVGMLPGLPLASAQAAAGSPSAPIGFDQALQLARQGPSVQLAALALQQAEARRDASFGNLSATLKAGYSVTAGERNGASVDDAGFDPISLAATFNVVPYGPVWDGYLSADRSVRSAQLAFDDARYKATADATGAYLRALRAQQQSSIDRSAVALAEGNQDHVETFAAKGDANAASVLAAQLATNQAQASFEDGRLDLEAALAQLGELLGQAVSVVEGEPLAAKASTDGSGAVAGPIAADAQAPQASADADAARAPDPAGTTETTAEPTADPTAMAADPTAANADITSALARRSDVLKARFDVDSAEASRAASIRNVLPTASLSADVRGGDGTTGWSGGLGYNTASFQPSLNASLSPGGGTGGATDGATFTLSLGVIIPLDTATPPTLRANELALNSAEARLQQVRDAATLAIRSAQRTLGTRERSASLAQQQGKQRELLLDQAKQRFALGLVSRVDVDQAQIDLERAELAARMAEDAVLSARMNVALALGLDPMEVF